MQASDENPYQMPSVDEASWFGGSHLGTQTQATNWQVVNCTTPANYFHVLRRQVGGAAARTSAAQLCCVLNCHSLKQLAGRHTLCRCQAKQHTTQSPARCMQATDPGASHSWSHLVTLPLPAPSPTPHTACIPSRRQALTAALCPPTSQIHRQFRKPLIIASPKSLLRHPKCKSPLTEFDDVPDDAGIVGVRFKRVIMDDAGAMPKSRAPNPPKVGAWRWPWRLQCPRAVQCLCSVWQARQVTTGVAGQLPAAKQASVTLPLKRCTKR